jgi:hypothetical protein
MSCIAVNKLLAKSTGTPVGQIHQSARQLKKRLGSSVGNAVEQTRTCFAGQIVRTVLQVAGASPTRPKARQNAHSIEQVVQAVDRWPKEARTSASVASALGFHRQKSPIPSCMWFESFETLTKKPTKAAAACRANGAQAWM